MEWGHFSYKKGTIEEYVGARGLKQRGTKKWRRDVSHGIARMQEVFHVDEIVLGGGNTKKIKSLPPGCRAGANANAFLGGFRMWEESSDRQPASRAKSTIDIATGRKKPKRTGQSA